MRPHWKDAGDYVAYVALRLVIMFIQSLPLSVCERGAELLAVLFGRTLGFRCALVDENLQRALPDSTPNERKAIALAMWKHLFVMVAEIAHTSRKVHRTTWRQHCTCPELKKVVEVLMQDRPTVILSGHYSNFEFGGYMLGLLGFPTHTVARTLDNRYVDRFVNEFRGRTGQHILPKQGSRVEIEQLLHSGGTLTLLGDQAEGPRGCWVNFFGKPASTHKAVALFTLGYDAPTMVMSSRRTAQPLKFEVDLAGLTDPTDADFQLGTTTTLIQWFTQCLEQTILKGPEQYWWVHRRWKGEPPEKVRRRLAKQAA